jgi:hypothetical protein
MRRRNVAFAFAVLAAVLITAMVRAGGGGGHDDHGRRGDRLSGFQENPDISTVARGSFKIDINDHDESITYALSYSGLEGTVTQAHVHFGKFGVNGGVSFFLCGTAVPPPVGSTGPMGTPTCPQEGTVERTIAAADIIGPVGQGIEAMNFEEIVAAIRRGNAYANVHSTKWPGGEIRAQISPRNARH